MLTNKNWQLLPMLNHYRVLYDSQSPPPKRVKVEPPTSYILDYAYLEDSTLKYERDNIVYTTYTLAELQNIGVQVIFKISHIILCACFTITYTSFIFNFISTE